MIEKRRDVLIISNLEPGDVTFDSDRGSWNVSRAIRDCAKGLHPAHIMNVAEIMDATVNIEFDPAKVDSLARGINVWAKIPPLIFVEESGRIWLIDGIHRVRALHRLGIKQCLGYVIAEKNGQRYRLAFNGERLPPWK